MGAPGWLKNVGKIGLAAAKVAFPAVASVEAGVKAFKDGTSSEAKLDAAEQIALSSIALAEDVTDKDLLSEPEVSAAYRGLLSAHVTFMNALASAKAARVHTAIGDPLENPNA